MLMKQTIQVTRRTGQWDGDDWVRDSVDPFTVKCSVQMNPGESHESEDEGRRRKSEIIIVSKVKLYPGSGSQDCDIVLWDGEQYEVTSVKPGGQGTRLAHYKSTAESVEDHADAAI